MARVLIVGILAFLFLQFAASQVPGVPSPACSEALNTLQSKLMTECSPATNALIICTGPCRSYFDDVISNCTAEFATAQQQALDTTCAGESDTEAPTMTEAPTTEGPATEGDDSDSPSTSCTDATNTLRNNIATCTSSSNPRIICTGRCREYYDDIIDNCSPELAAPQQQALDTVCSSTNGGNNGGSNGGDTGGASVFKGLGVYSLLLLSVIAAVIF